MSLYYLFSEYLTLPELLDNPKVPEYVLTNLTCVSLIRKLECPQLSSSGVWDLFRENRKDVISFIHARNLPDELYPKVFNAMNNMSHQPEWMVERMMKIMSRKVYLSMKEKFMKGDTWYMLVDNDNLTVEDLKEMEKHYDDLYEKCPGNTFEQFKYMGILRTIRRKIKRHDSIKDTMEILKYIYEHFVGISSQKVSHEPSEDTITYWEVPFDKVKHNLRMRFSKMLSEGIHDDTLTKFNQRFKKYTVFRELTSDFLLDILLNPDYLDDLNNEYLLKKYFCFININKLSTLETIPGCIIPWLYEMMDHDTFMKLTDKVNNNELYKVREHLPSYFYQTTKRMGFLEKSIPDLSIHLRREIAKNPVIFNLHLPKHLKKMRSELIHDLHHGIGCAAYREASSRFYNKTY